MSILKYLLAPFNTSQMASSQQLLSSLMMMAWVVEARDPYTGGHLWRVSKLSRLLAEKAGLPAHEITRITIGGFLHDLGKIGIPDAILNKKDKLSDAEYAIIKTHPELGRRMLAGHPLYDWVSDAIYLHHETPDGTGYPQGLRASAIPQIAKIVGICDAFDAMTSTRPYRQGMAISHALDIITRNLGNQFDMGFGQHFLSLANQTALQHIVGHTDAGIPIHDCQMCGPTIEIQVSSAQGDLAYCKACHAEYKLQAPLAPHQFVLTPTGQKGDAATMTVRPDAGIINQVLADLTYPASVN